MERGVFIVSGHHQAWLVLPSPPEPSVPAPAMLQLGPSPAPHSPAQRQSLHLSQPGPSPGCLHPAGVVGQAPVGRPWPHLLGPS